MKPAIAVFVTALFIAAEIIAAGFGGIAVHAEVEQAYVPVPSTSSGSRGCVLVNSGKIDFQVNTTNGGGTTSQAIRQLKAGEWLTVNVSASLPVVAFLEVFDPGTTRRLQSKLVAEIDPQSGTGSMATAYPVSAVEADNSVQIVTGYQGAGSYKVTVRCTTYDPRKVSS